MGSFPGFRLPGLLALALLAAGCAHGVSPTAATEATTWRLSSDLLVRQLVPRVLVVTHEQPFPANSVVVETRDGTLVFVGSPYTAAATGTVLAWLESRFGRRKRIAIDTHFHDDAGVGGHAAFRAAAIPIHASDATARLLGERDPAAAPPEHLFPLAQGLVLELGEPVRVAFPGPGHTRDNVVVHFPAERLLVGGCLLKAGSSIGNTADADFANWAASARTLAAYDVDWVVPGHGDRFDRGLIANTVEVVSRAASR